MIWVKGIKGLVTVGEKYIVAAMGLKSVEMFFDLLVFINIIILALEGFYDSRAFTYLNNIITFLLVSELFMKMVSHSISNRNPNTIFLK